MLQLIINWLQQSYYTIPEWVWGSFVEMAFSAIIVSGSMQKIKKWFHVNSEKVKVLLVIFSSMFASAVIYLRDVPLFAEWWVVIQGLLIFAGTQPAYFWFIKPLFQRVSAWWGRELAKASVQREVLAAEVPASGLPQPTEAVANEDFSH